MTEDKRKFRAEVPDITAEAQVLPARPAKRVYLDVCALNRPLDDQEQMRIRLEADAVQLVLSHVRSGELVLIVSPVHRAEVAANPDPARREHVQLLLQELGVEAEVDRQRTRQRAEALIRDGLKSADATHLAFAEATNSDFVTVDDRLLRQCQRVASRVWTGTPGAFCEKEDLK